MSHTILLSYSSTSLTHRAEQLLLVILRPLSFGAILASISDFLQRPGAAGR
jgi:hypothetical protein